MRAELERLHGRVFVLRVFEGELQPPAPYLLAMVAVERRWWWPWQRTARLVALARPERLTKDVVTVINNALANQGFKRAVWDRWRGLVHREVVVPVKPAGEA